MKAYQINILSTKDSRATQELSCVTKAENINQARNIANKIIDENQDKYDSIKLQNISEIDA